MASVSERNFHATGAEVVEHGYTVVSMAKVLALNWWALALRGAAGIVAGALAWLLPGDTFRIDRFIRGLPTL
jgi:DNA-binding IclR family transcriptional regulator